MARTILRFISLLVAGSLALALVSPPPPTIRSLRLSQQSHAFRLAAMNNRNDNDNDHDDSSSKPDTTLRKRLFGLALPIGVAISANAPFLYVIAKPPSAEEREVMLMDFCKGDTCTLLGGGSGYAGGDTGGELIGAEVARAMPSVEEFEAMARTAAEAASALSGAIDIL